STRRINRITSPNGRWVEFTYLVNPDTSLALITQIKDNIGRTVSYEYGEYWHLTKVTDPAGGITEYTYTPGQAMGQVVTVKDARGIVWLKNMTYDAKVRVTRQTFVDDTFYDFAYTLDANGKVIQTDVTNPRGYVRRVTFNAAGYVMTDTQAYGIPALAQTTTYVRGVDNLITSMTDALGRVTAYYYDPDSAGVHNLLTVTRLSGTSDAITTTFTYEPTFNQLATVTDPLSHTTTFGHDAFGNVTSITNPLGPPTQTTLTYNYTDRVESRTDPLLRAESYGYDNNGNRTSFIDRKSQPTASTYDELDRLKLVTYADNSTTEYHYDAGNRVTQIVDSIGGTITFTYDGLDRLLTETASLGTVTYTYDAAGRRRT